MNQVCLIGRLGQDPEVRYTSNGTAVASLRVAVNDRYGDSQRTYWFTVICWNRLAELVSEFVSKGSKVGISGKLTTRSYENRNGDTIYLTEIVANQVQFLDPRGGLCLETV